MSENKNNTCNFLLHNQASQTYFQFIFFKLRVISVSRKGRKYTPDEMWHPRSRILAFGEPMHVFGSDLSENVSIEILQKIKF